MDYLKRCLILTLVLVVSLTAIFYTYVTWFIQHIHVVQAQVGITTVQLPPRTMTEGFTGPNGYEVNNHGANVKLLVRRDRQKNATYLKTILFWNNAYGGKTYNFGHGREPFYKFKCPETRCVTTDNQSYLPRHSSFDAIIIHHPEVNASILPWPRDPRQRFIFWSKESAQWYPANKYEEGFFNWTMTFRMDSDIPAPYGRFVQVKTHATGAKLEEFIIQFGMKNVHLAGRRSEFSLSWLASNCKSVSKRRNLVNKIAEYVKVTVYGSCGNTACFPGNSFKCMKQLESTHKFYLSFENSLCKDYVTEKFFNVFDFNMIPIVFGLANYTKIAPPKSFINMLSFPTVKHLVEHLTVLQNNDAKFAEYFWWRDFYALRNRQADDAQGFCELCRKLHDVTEPAKVYHNLSGWWQTNSQCHQLNIDVIVNGTIKLMKTF